MVKLHGPASPSRAHQMDRAVAKRLVGEGTTDNGDAGCTHAVSVGPEPINRPSFQDSTHENMEFAMAVIVSNDALSRLRQETRRRRIAAEFREISRLRRSTEVPRPIYRPKPQFKLIVSNR